MGLKSVPGVRISTWRRARWGSNCCSSDLAGWAGGQSWITPGLLLERGNFARDILFPDISSFRPTATPAAARSQSSERIRRE